MPSIFRGKAQVSGSKMALDVFLYPIVESADLTQNWEEDMVKDGGGDDYSVRAHNEKWEGDIGMALVDQSSSSTLSNAEAGAAFNTPLITITITTSQIASWNGVWQLAPGNTLKALNTSYGKGGVKLRRWADATQNTLMTSTPS